MIELVRADGPTREVRFDGLSSDSRFMRKWVELYHGEGRPWLMYGKVLHPPKIESATITCRDRRIPAVFHNAFLSPDSKAAVVLANATREPQTVTFSWHGKSIPITLEAGGLELVR